MSKQKKLLTPEARQERIDEDLERRRRVGLLEPGEEDEAVDRMIRKNIKDHGA
jgi:hypothetical protein